MKRFMMLVALLVAFQGEVFAQAETPYISAMGGRKVWYNSGGGWIGMKTEPTRSGWILPLGPPFREIVYLRKIAHDFDRDLSIPWGYRQSVVTGMRVDFGGPGRFVRIVVQDSDGYPRRNGEEWRLVGPGGTPIFFVGND